MLLNKRRFNVRVDDVAGNVCQVLICPRLTQETRVQSALDDVASNIHAIGCYSTQGTRVQLRVDDVASSMHGTLHPGGYFDPFGLASNPDPAAVFKLKTAELKHGGGLHSFTFQLQLSCLCGPRNPT